MATERYGYARIERLIGAGGRLSEWLDEHRAEIVQGDSSLYWKVYRKWLWCADQYHEFFSKEGNK